MRSTSVAQRMSGCRSCSSWLAQARVSAVHLVTGDLGGGHAAVNASVIIRIAGPGLAPELGVLRHPGLHASVRVLRSK